MSSNRTTAHMDPNTALGIRLSGNPLVLPRSVQFTSPVRIRWVRIATKNVRDLGSNATKDQWTFLQWAFQLSVCHPDSIPPITATKGREEENTTKWNMKYCFLSCHCIPPPSTGLGRPGEAHQLSVLEYLWCSDGQIKMKSISLTYLWPFPGASKVLDRTLFLWCSKWG